MRTHGNSCEADTGHDYDCGTATQLAKLTAFAEAVRDEFTCTVDRDHPATEDHVQDCWHHAACEALEPPK